MPLAASHRWGRAKNWSSPTSPRRRHNPAHISAPGGIILGAWFLQLRARPLPGKPHHTPTDQINHRWHDDQQQYGNHGYAHQNLLFVRHRWIHHALVTWVACAVCPGLTASQQLRLHPWGGADECGADGSADPGGAVAKLATIRSRRVELCTDAVTATWGPSKTVEPDVDSKAQISPSPGAPPCVLRMLPPRKVLSDGRGRQRCQELPSGAPVDDQPLTVCPKRGDQ